MAGTRQCLMSSISKYKEMRQADLMSVTVTDEL